MSGATELKLFGVLVEIADKSEALKRFIEGCGCQCHQMVFSECDTCRLTTMIDEIATLASGAVDEEVPNE